jgi:hypothetical protein
MFYRFNAHRAKKQQVQESSTDKLAKKIAGSISAIQRSWATFMDRHARKLPPKQLKALLVVLVLGSGAYCAYLLGEGIFSQAFHRFTDFELAKLWPFDPLGNKEKLRREDAWDHYLDSLELQVKHDSLQNPQYYIP